MDEKLRKKLKDDGRSDLAKMLDITAEGYAGVLRTGQLVDRRKYLQAIPVQKSTPLNTPEPKDVTLQDVLEKFSDFVSEHGDADEVKLINYWIDQYTKEDNQ